MGGKKKLSMRQLERTRRKKDDQGKKKKEKVVVSTRENRPSGIVPPDPKDEKIVGEIKRMRVLTPYTVASRLNIKMSAAKVFLGQLETIGVVQMVSGNHSIKIYRPVD